MYNKKIISTLLAVVMSVSLVMPATVTSYADDIVDISAQTYDAQESEQKRGTGYIELDDDEYFYDDLIGCQIINNDQEIGKVESVYFNGAHDVLTVQTANKKIAIPYVDAFIENEDIENKKIFVHLIKGMYDED